LRKKRITPISKNSEKEKLIRKLLSDTNKEKIENEAKSEREQRQVVAAEKTAFWTQVLAVFTIGLAIVGIATVIILGIQICDMRNDAQIDHRQWVAPYAIQKEGDAIHGFIFRIHFRNTGKTPANRTTAHIGYVTDINSIPDIQEKKTDDCEILAPGCSANVDTGERPLMQKDINVIKNKKLPFFIYITILYRNIDGNKHRTEFCYVASSDFNTFSGSPDGAHSQMN
jgi:hypothetical protein